VIDAPTQALLQAIVRRESRSLLQYVRDAFPWTSTREHEALGQIQKLIDEELQAAADLNRFLIRHHANTAYLGPYPMSFAAINYVSLDHLLPLVVDNEQQAVARLQSDLTRLADPDARTQVQKILDMKQRHLKVLEGLASARPEAVAQ
jgi:hypothetical protein